MPSARHAACRGRDRDAALLLSSRTAICVLCLLLLAQAGLTDRSFAADDTASEAATLPQYRSDAMLQTRVVDEDGVVTNPNPHGDGLYYNGVSMCQVALTAFGDYERHGEPRHLARALKHTDKFLELSVWRGDNALVFPYAIDNPVWGAKTGEWSSGMAQGLALSVMVKAHRLTGNEAYLEAADAIFESMRMGLDEGGTLGCWADGCPSIEEVAQPNEPGGKILNGFIAAMTRVLEYAEYTGSKEALAFFDTCMGSVRHHIPEYDFGWWSTYDQIGTHASHYNELHCRQLVWCYEHTGAPLFLQHALKFASYAYEPPLLVSLVEGDPASIIAGFGIENLTLPPPPERKYFSYRGALPATLEIDLGVEHYVSGLRFESRAARAMPTAYSIRVSTDRVEWVEVARRSDDDVTKKEHFFEDAYLCRYIRLRVTRTSGGNDDKGWFTISRILPTLRLPLVARGKGSSPYAHMLLPGIADNLADQGWRQVTGNARLYYDLAAPRPFRAVRVIPREGTTGKVSVVAAVSSTGHVWRPVALSHNSDEVDLWLAEALPIARYLRLDITNDSSKPLFLENVDVLADGAWPSLHPDRLRPRFDGQIASATDVPVGPLRLLGASQVLPSALRPGSSFRIDVFFTCIEQLAASDQYGCVLALSQGQETHTLGTRPIRTAHARRSWEGLRFREMLHASLPSDLPPGTYDVTLDIVQVGEGAEPGRSLLPSGAVQIGSLYVLGLPSP